MPLWLFICVAAFGGALILLHAFNKAKESSEAMLDAYKDMLEESLEVMSQDEDEEAEESSDDDDAVLIVPDEEAA